MIPLTLSLKNFLSYGPNIQTVSFEPYSFICLSGKNGHGKSALLDAITWAMWGQARKISGASRLEEHLLHLLETNMLVVFEFMSSGKKYRIKRGFTKQATKGIISLEFGIMDHSTHIISLTGKTIRETQQTIIKEIGLDFETFLNSSFLRQGDANEFSKKTPKERKDLLGRILSLEYYESIKKISHEKTKELTTTKESLFTQQKALIQTQETFAFLDTAISHNQEKRTTNEQQIENIQQKLTTITTIHTQTVQDCWIAEKSMETAEKNNQQQNLYRKKLQTLLKDRTLMRQTLHHQQSIKELLIQKETLLQHIFTQQQYLEEKITYEQDLLNQQQMLMFITKKHEQEMLKRKESFLQQQETIKSERKTANSHINQLQKEIITLKYQLQQTGQQIQTFTCDISQQETQAQYISLFVQRLQKRSTLYHQLIQKHKETIKLIQELALQKEFLEKTSDSCPLCLSQLVPHTKQTVLEALCSKKEQLLKKQLKIRMLIETITCYIDKEAHRKKQYEALVAQKEEQKNLLFQAISIKKHLEENIVQHQTLITTLQTNNSLLEQQEKALEQNMQKTLVLIKNNTEFQTLSKAIMSLESLIASCHYDKTLHKKYMQDLDAVCLQIKTIEKEDYVTKLANINEQIHQTCSLLRQIKKHLNENEYHQEKYETLQKKIAVLQATIQSYQKTLQSLRLEREILLQEQGKLTSQKKQQETLNQILNSHDQTLLRLSKEINHYEAIFRIMGKDGIQALLVEQAIPEIEFEANAILSRLSSNEMHIFIESVKDLKSGKTKETLDISISDAKGTRPYELFSGGEAFRIDLSLRIALSKLLAHRAGTTIETLIIDEGFGSQDEEGISMIIDALYKIQSDFKKIIIVSHLSHLKEQIPVHFYVAKTAAGSSISVAS